MRLYDLVLILRPTLTEGKRKQAIDTIKKLLKDATFTKEEDWGQKVLTYPIKRELSGYYVMLGFESVEGITKDFETKLIQSENILRHLLIRNK